MSNFKKSHVSMPSHADMGMLVCMWMRHANMSLLLYANIIL